MRALDTNVLVRFVTCDDAGQAAVVERLFAECHRNHEHLFISAPVICELVWVLKNGLRQARTEIVKLLDRLTEDDLFQIEREPLVLRALARYREGKADFADYLIGEIATAAACRDTVTFDKTLKNAPGFTIL
jgi:predicted nucleic-acid-binding protein